MNDSVSAVNILFQYLPPVLRTSELCYAAVTVFNGVLAVSCSDIGRDCLAASSSQITQLAAVAAGKNLLGIAKFWTQLLNG
jgi:hypothetical protein